MRTPNRKPAQLAFTAGPERQAAYWIEVAQAESSHPETDIAHEPDGWPAIKMRDVSAVLDMAEGKKNG